MKKRILEILMSLVIISTVYAGISLSMQEADEPVTATNQDKNSQGPAGKFTPTEKLRADDAVAFPVDI